MYDEFQAQIMQIMPKSESIIDTLQVKVRRKVQALKPRLN
jgi:hypothetical protein